MTDKLTHALVAKRATALIKRLHGCFIGAVEFSGGWSGEHVDGIAFNAWGSFLIEAKVSRADFLADSKKEFRIKPETGVGKFRYYACPVGLISPEEIPEKWGLIYVPEKGKCTMPKGYGGNIKIGEQKNPLYGWSEPIYDRYGDRFSNALADEDSAFRFYQNEFCQQKERNFLLYLAKRYKQNKFMDNIL